MNNHENFNEKIGRRKFISGMVQTAWLIGAGGMLQPISLKAAPYAEQAKLRFAIASDGHFGQQGTPYADYHQQMMDWLNQEEKQNLNFTVFNGDLIHDEREFFSGLKGYYGTLRMPYYVSRGNHDRCDATTWKETWGVDLNYTFERNDSGFIVLDTSNENGDYVCPDTAWAESALKKFRDKESVFVFMHITPIKWTKNGISCRKLINMFRRQRNLVAVFHGHDHDHDFMKEEGNKPFFFDGHLGGNWGVEYRGYRIVEVYESGRVITYQVNPQQNNVVNTFTMKSRSAAG